MAIIAQVGKLTLGNFGKPVVPEGGQQVLGIIGGKAADFVERSSPKDPSEKFEGLKGAFRFVPDDKARETLESGVMFVPDAFHNLIADQLRLAKKDDPAAMIEFAFIVSAVWAKNAAGYSWKFAPVFDTQRNNPLDTLFAEINKAVAKLPAPATKTVEDHSKGKGK